MKNRVFRQTRTDLPPASPGRFLVLSDRLPIRLTRCPREGLKVAPAHGALISALAPVLRDRGGVWIGWPGVSEEEAPGLRKVLAGGIHPGGVDGAGGAGGGYSLRPVSLTERDVQGCYRGFGREVIWPLFHGQPLDCDFDPAYWQAYRRVNRKFARTVARTVARSGGGADFVWVHNHLLMNTAAELRRFGVPSRTGFFLHVPFPAPDLFLQLPWRRRLMSALLAYDQLGFQTRRDLANFLDGVRELFPGALLHPGAHGVWTVRAETPDGPAELRAGAFPVGVDYRGFAGRAARPEVEARLAALRTTLHGRRMVLGVDHLDRAQGIPEKLRAFARALELSPGLAERVTLTQVVVPSREGLPRHAALRAEIERMVGEINGRFSRAGWVPVCYYHRALEADDLVAHYRAADVALLTPLREGMNLVAKEYCAADLDERGALVLSEFAGAAAQLGGSLGALKVNPYDIQATARTLVRALEMGEEERRARMRNLRREVRRHDVHAWAGAFLGAALGARGAALEGLDEDGAATAAHPGLQSYN
ncbi:MAG TPA: trehalose-6-phosphate synthase [Thermoanaerobaculia bacterium]|nr:trehalose-6-phosphate synthase [Thermoanaerobaculia bacterium]